MELRGINISALATPELLIKAGITDVKSLTVPWHLGWGPDQKLGERSAQVSPAFTVFWFCLYTDICIKHVIPTDSYYTELHRGFESKQADRLHRAGNRR